MSFFTLIFWDKIKCTTDGYFYELLQKSEMDTAVHDSNWHTLISQLFYHCVEWVTSDMWNNFIMVGNVSFSVYKVNFYKLIRMWQKYLCGKWWSLGMSLWFLEKVVPCMWYLMLVLTSQARFKESCLSSAWGFWFINGVSHFISIFA